MCTTCKKCQKCCSESSCRDQASRFLANLAGSGCGSESGSDPKRGSLHSSLSDPTKTHKVPHSHKPLCRSSQEQLPVRGIASAYRQKCSGTSTKSGLPRVLQPTIFSPKTKQQVVTHPGSEQIKPFPQRGKIQNGNTGNHQNLPPDRGVGHLHRFQRGLLPHSYTGTVQERSHVQGQTYQLKALPFGLSTAPLEFTVVAKEVKLIALYKGIRIHQYLDDWFVRATSHQVCLQHTKLLVQICQDLGWLVNLEKSELEPKQVFDFVGYQFDLQSGRVRPTPERWQNLQQKILTLLSVPTCPVREFMSLIGLLTATEKQVHLGRLHMRPIQWHLNSTRIPREGHSNSQVLAPPSRMVVGRQKCTHRPTTTPSKACSANFYRRIERRMGRSLRRAYCKRNLVVARKQATYKLPRTQMNEKL